MLYLQDYTGMHGQQNIIFKLCMVTNAWYLKGPQCENCFMSPFCHLLFWGGPLDLWKFCAPLALSYTKPASNRDFKCILSYRKWAHFFNQTHSNHLLWLVGTAQLVSHILAVIKNGQFGLIPLRKPAWYFPKLKDTIIDLSVLLTSLLLTRANRYCKHNMYTSCLKSMEFVWISVVLMYRLLIEISHNVNTKHIALSMRSQRGNKFKKWRV